MRRRRWAEQPVQRAALVEAAAARRAVPRTARQERWQRKRREHVARGTTHAHPEATRARSRALTTVQFRRTVRRCNADGMPRRSWWSSMKARSGCCCVYAAISCNAGGRGLDWLAAALPWLASPGADVGQPVRAQMWAVSPLAFTHAAATLCSSYRRPCDSRTATPMRAMRAKLARLRRNQTDGGLKQKASDGLSAALRFGLRTSSSPAVRCVVVRVACCAAWRLHAGPRAGDGVCRLVDARARPDAAGRGRTQRCSLFSHSPPSVVCCACRLAPRRVLACKSRRLPDCIVVWRLALRARTADALAPSMHCTAPCVPMRTSNGSPSTVCSKPYAFQCVRHDRHDRRCCGD